MTTRGVKQGGEESLKKVCHTSKERPIGALKRGRPVTES
jgi:hypothetical protein